MYAPRLSMRLLEKQGKSRNAGKFTAPIPVFQNPMKHSNDDDDDDDDGQPFKFPKLFGNNNNDDVYDLYAASLKGGGPRAGHYISYTKNDYDGNWYLYNDSNQVRMAYTKENLQNNNAYLLFYYRHD